MQSDKDVFDKSPPPLVERIARIDGQSNFLSLLAGVEAGKDTTQDMAALAISRNSGAMPEVLEAYIGGTDRHRIPLMSALFATIKDELRPKETDYPWVQGAIADAYLMLCVGQCKPLGVRAKRFGVRVEAYGTIRKIAWQTLVALIDRAERAYCAAMRRGVIRETESKAPADRHTQDEGGLNLYVERARSGSYVQRPLPASDDAGLAAADTKGVGMADRLSWDQRNAAPGPVTTIQPDSSGESLSVQRPADRACESRPDPRQSHNRPTTRRRGEEAHSARPRRPLLTKGAKRP